VAEPTTLPVSAESVVTLMNDMRIAAEQSLARVEAYAATNAQALAKVVVAYRAAVADTGGRLVRLQVRVIHALAQKPGDPALTALLKRTISLLTAWSAHAKGYTAYERPATEAEKSGAVSVGWAGIVIAVAAAAAVIAVSFTGVAWAVVHYKEAQTLSDEIAIIERDPTLAEAIAKINTTAPSSPTPDPTNPGGGNGGGWGWLLAALGLAGAAFFIVPKLGKG
jgi:hypothetical protein